jgi:hypothetical protein
MHAGFPIGFVVEGRDDDVPPFVPVWVVTVVVDDETSDGVIVGVHPGHDRSLKAIPTTDHGQ